MEQLCDNADQPTEWVIWSNLHKTICWSVAELLRKYEL